MAAPVGCNVAGQDPATPPVTPQRAAVQTAVGDGLGTPGELAELAMAAGDGFDEPADGTHGDAPAAAPPCSWDSWRFTHWIRDRLPRMSTP